MASRIKGITVEIGGDTTGLDKALKNVQATIRQTQSSLKDVNRLLKLDPKNTELIAQKQRLLASSIEATKEKLNSLKVASEQAKAQMEAGNLGQDKYDALQREIAETESALKRLEAEARNFNSSFSKIDAVGKNMKRAGDAISGVGQKVMPASVAVSGLGTLAVKTAGDFDYAMGQVSAISGAVGDDLLALRNKAREMGATTRYSATDAAGALGYMAQAGWSTEQMLSGIDGVMHLAAASGEDLAMTSDIVVGSLNAFGLKAQDAGHFADVLATTSAASNTNVAMLGETFKYCAPVAGALGFKVEETAEAIGLMSNAGIKSTQAGTALRTILNSLSHDLEISSESLGKVVVHTTNADGSMRSLNEILGDCREAFSGLTESEKVQAAETLVGKNAMSGFLALMNAAPEDVENLRGALNNASGSAEHMAEVMQDNLPGQIQQLKSALEELAISIGDALMPTIRDIVTHIQGFVEKLNGMDEGTRDLIIKIGLFVAALGPVLIIVGQIVSSIGTLLSAGAKVGTLVGGLLAKVGGLSGIVTKLSSVIGGLSVPVLVIIGVLAALAAVFVHLWNSSESFRNSITESVTRIVEAFQGFFSNISEKLSALGISIDSFSTLVSTVWNGLCELLAPVIEAAFSLVAGIVESALGILGGIIDVFAGLLGGNWEMVWNGICEIVQGVVNAILSVIQSFCDAFTGIVDTVLSWFNTSWDEIWTGAQSLFENVWNGITSFFGGIWDTIKGVATGALDGLFQSINSVLDSIKNSFSNIWQGISQSVSTIVSQIFSRISSVFESMKSFVTNIFNSIKSVATSVWEAIKNAIVKPIENAQNAVRSIIDRIKGFFSGLHIQLPRIKLPHFKISGDFSIVPPRVPHLSIEWYKHGGIMTRPTIFGMNAGSLMAGGEAGPEAILPLKEFYTRLEDMLAPADTSTIEDCLYKLLANSEKAIVLDSGALVGALTSQIDASLGRQAQFVQRRMR